MQQQAKAASPTAPATLTTLTTGRAPPPTMTGELQRRFDIEKEALLRQAQALPAEPEGQHVQ
eukprot:885471-Amphidinium_carterae.1